jgi:hypothetical protein
MFGWLHQWRFKRITRKMDRLGGKAMGIIQSMPRESDPHGVDKLVRTAAISVAAELLIEADMPDRVIIAALVAGTGIEAAVMDALLGASDVNPVPKLRAAMRQDIADNPELEEGGALGKAAWCLTQVWRDGPGDLRFGHAEIDVPAFVSVVMNDLKARGLFSDVQAAT